MEHEAAPLAPEKFPAAHTTQAVALVAPRVKEEVPAAQGVHAVSPAKL
jgi:hypothetical protein